MIGSGFRGGGINGVWWDMLIANIVAAIIGIYLFQKGTWKEKEI